MSLLERAKSWYAPVQPLSAEILHYQTPPDAAQQYRLHLPGVWSAGAEVGIGGDQWWQRKGCQCETLRAGPVLSGAGTKKPERVRFFCRL